MNRGHVFGIIGIICLLVFFSMIIKFGMEENIAAFFKMSAIYLGIASILGVLVRKYREWFEEPLF